MRLLMKKIKCLTNLKLWLITVVVFITTIQPVFAGIEEFMYGLVVATFGRLVGLAGSALNYSVANFVIGFGDIYIDEGLGKVISVLWGNIRDIINIVFIFALVYIGLKLILDSSNPNAKRWLLNLIAAALLVNFSLFISKAVIDFSNIMATQISQPFINNGKINISETFMEKIGVVTILGKSKDGGVSYTVIENIVKKGGSPWPYIIGIMIVFLITAFVFFAGAILLMVRFVSLVFYLIFSPFMFLGWILPNMSSITARYWKELLGKSLMAPVYLLLLYFSFKILEIFFLPGNNNLDFGAVLTGDGKDTVSSFNSTIPPFIIAIILLLASLKMSQKLGADGAAFVNSMGIKASRKLRNKTIRAAAGTAKFAGKTPVRTVGYLGGRKASYALGNKLDRQLRRLQSKKTFKRPEKSTSKSRVARTLDNTLGTATAAAKYGAASTVGWLARSKVVDDRVKKTAKTMKDGKFFLGETQQEYNQRITRISKESNRVLSSDELIAKYNESETAEQRRELANQANFIRNMSTEEIQTLIPKGDLSNGLVAYNLTDKQIKSMLDSGHITEKEADKIKASRDNATFSDLNESINNLSQSTDKIESAVKELSEIIKSLSSERLENMDFNYLINGRYAMHLTSGQMQHLKQSGRFTSKELEEIEAARVRGMKSVIDKTILEGENIAAEKRDRLIEVYQKTLFEKMNNKEMSSLPKELLLNKGIAVYLTPVAVDSRLKEGDLSAADLATLSNNINSVIRQDAQKAKSWRKWQERSMMGGVLSLDTTSKDNKHNKTQTHTITDSMKHKIKELETKIKNTTNEDETSKLKAELDREKESLYRLYKDKLSTEGLSADEVREWGTMVTRSIKDIRDRLHVLQTARVENRDKLMSELELKLQEKLQDEAKLAEAYKQQKNIS